MKRIHLLRCPHSSSLRRTSKYTSFLRPSGALHLGIFEQPVTSFSYRKIQGEVCEERLVEIQGEKRWMM